MKRVIIIAITIFTCVQAFAQKQFSIGPYFSIREGTLYEYVYSSESDSKEVSLLEWNYSPLYCLGLSGDFTNGRFGIHTKIDFAISGRCGSMTDSDFFYINGIKDTCNYSISENSCRQNFNTELGLDYTFFPSDYLVLKPAFRLQYTYNSFKAENGRGRYGRAPYSKTGKDVNWQSEDAKDVKLYGCEFYRHEIFTWAGIEPTFNVKKNLKVGFGLFTSLYTYTYSIDHHLGKPTNDTYIDMAASNFFSKFKYSFFTEVDFSTRLSFNASLEFIRGTIDKGKTRAADYTEEYHFISQKTGSNINQTSFSTGLKITL